MNPLVSIARKASLRRNTSTVQTGIVPLGRIHRATVFVDASELDCAACVAAILKWFGSMNITITVYAIDVDEYSHVSAADGAVMLNRRCLGLSGAVRKGKHIPVIDGKEDLFIDLCAKNHFAAEHAARCSNALFKAGREQLKGQVYDLVIGGSEGKTQQSVFETITGILKIVQ